MLFQVQITASWGNGAAPTHQSLLNRNFDFAIQLQAVYSNRLSSDRVLGSAPPETVRSAIKSVMPAERA